MGSRPAPIQQRFGTRVRALRRRARLTQAVLADRAGIDPKYLGAIERGEKNVTLDLIGRIGQGLGLQVGELFLFDDAGVRPPERVTTDWLVDRLNGCPAEDRDVIAAINALLFRLVEADGGSRT